MNSFAKIFAAAAFTLFAGAASAATIWVESGTACSTSDITNVTSSQCFGFTDGNIYGSKGVDVNNDQFDYLIPPMATDTGLFGYHDWAVIGGSGSVGGDMKFGDISVPTNQYDMLAVLLKGSNEWAAYLIEGTGGLLDDISFAMGNNHGLSNYLIVGRAEVVPLPAAGLLLIGGLGGLALMRRRRKKA